MPVFFMLVSWPIYKWITGIEHAFEKALGGGDLVLFSALLLIGVMIELEHIQSIEKQLQNNRWEWLKAKLALVFGVILLFLYAVIKYDFVTYQFPSAGTECASKIRGFAYLSIGCMLFAIGLATYWTWNTIEKIRIVQDNEK